MIECQKLELNGISYLTYNFDTHCLIALFASNS